MKKIMHWILLIVLLAASTFMMYTANNIQNDNGQVEIIESYIPLDGGKLTYKLYKPISATASSKAPGVLLLHGYQNDHETCAAYAIELARRGAVVLCLDEYGHGSSNLGLIKRGYVNHKVSVNYGNDSPSDGTFTDIGGTIRYRLLMNFSNLSFFNDKYSKDNDGNSIIDSSCGGSAAYDYLSKLDYVDNSRMALSGHSMGTWSSWSVAADYANTNIAPKAIVLQCGELFRNSVYDNNKIKFNNVLLLQAKYDEFSYFRDYQLNVTDDLLKTPLRYEFLGTNANNAKWNTTYGNFNDGSARRMELLYTNHRLTTHDLNGLETSLKWFDDALNLPIKISYNQINAKIKEYLVLGAMLCVLFALFPLMNILLGFYLYSDVESKLPEEEDILPKSKRIKSALFTILISGLSFPFMTQLGHALLPLPEKIFRMTVGNGFLSYYLLLIIVTLISNIFSRIYNKKNKIKIDKFDFPTFLGSLILAVTLFLFVYLVNFVYSKVFNLDLRFIWPFFKPFTLIRLGQFFVYLPIFVAYFLASNGKIMKGLRNHSTYQKGIFGFIKNWFHNFIIMAGGVLLIVLLEYVPFFLGIGPGADVLFGSTFGGPFMSILILFVPQVLFYSILCTYSYRRTGEVYTGAILAGMLACWIVTGGSSFL